MPTTTPTTLDEAIEYILIAIDGAVADLNDDMPDDPVFGPYAEVERIDVDTLLIRSDPEVPAGPAVVVTVRRVPNGQAVLDTGADR